MSGKGGKGEIWMNRMVDLWRWGEGKDKNK